MFSCIACYTRVHTVYECILPSSVSCESAVRLHVTHAALRMLTFAELHLRRVGSQSCNRACSADIFQIKKGSFLARILELKKVDDETAVGRVKGDADWLRRRH